MIMEVFSPEDARKYAEYMYDPAFRPEPHQVEWVHTALAAAAGFTASRNYNDQLTTSGKGNLEQPNSATMKDMLASYASSEVDKVITMKCLNFIDAQQVKTHAAEQALYLVNRHYDSNNSRRQPGVATTGGEAASYYNAGPSSHQAQAPAYAPPSGPPPSYQAHGASWMGYGAQVPQVGYAMPPQPNFPSDSSGAFGDHNASHTRVQTMSSSTFLSTGPSTFLANFSNLSDRDRRKLEKQQRKAQRKAEKERIKGMSKEARRTYKEQRRAAKMVRRQEKKARRKCGRRCGSSSSSSSSDSD